MLIRTSFPPQWLQTPLQPLFTLERKSAVFFIYSSWRVSQARAGLLKGKYSPSHVSNPNKSK